MYLVETVKLYMTKSQKDIVTDTMYKYIDTVNMLVSTAVSGISIRYCTSANVNTDIPSALKSQCIRDANSIVNKYKRLKRNTKRDITIPKLKKPCFYVNNANFKILDNCINFPVRIDGKTQRIFIRASITDRQKELFTNKLGTLRIVCKGNTIVAQVTYKIDTPKHTVGGNIMGIDLGIKCPAVSYTSDGNIKFYGNGRKNKYIRRHYAYLRKKLQKSKNIKNINHKEQNIMRDIDHKISHDIVKTALAHNVSVIKLEQIDRIYSATRTSRKNNNRLHTWSFYRLAYYIKYKAKKAGIAVEYVNPAFTSQTCPKCGKIHRAKDRTFACKCGYRIHRDLLGAINICNSTEYVGKRHTA